MYATAAQLLDRASADDIAEAAAPNDRDVSADLITALLTAADTSNFEADAVTKAGEALQRITNRIEEASAVIDSYIRTRYPRLIPYPDPVNASLLQSICLDIVEWKLLGGDVESARYRAGTKATVQLEGIAAGRVTLHSQEAEVEKSGAMAQSDPARFRGDPQW